MRKTGFAKDEEAVSPVVGVILMVAITVILAAIIAAFVLGIGSPKQGPKASIRLVKASPGVACIEHQGGDKIDLTTVTVTAAGSIRGNGFRSTSDNTTAKTTLAAGEGAIAILGAAAGDGTTIRLTDNVSNQQIAQMTIGTTVSSATPCP